MRGLREFLESYLPFFGREEVRENAYRAILSLVSNIERKSAENLAKYHGLPRRAMQRLVGSGYWKDELLLGVLRSQVAEDIGDPDGTFVFREFCFPKRGSNSVGVAKQWNPRSHKIENCQRAILLIYISKYCAALVDRRLFLPEEWTGDPGRLRACHCPEKTRFHAIDSLSSSMLSRDGAEIPRRWIVGEEPLLLRSDRFYSRYWFTNAAYMCEVPPGRVMRGDEILDNMQPRTAKSILEDYRGRSGHTSPCIVQSTRADGLVVDVRVTPHRVKTEEKMMGSGRTYYRWRELLLSMEQTQTTEEPRYFLTNRDDSITLQDRVRAIDQLARADKVIEDARKSVGLDQYEVRSWVGWHHHMTLAMIAYWFLVRQEARRRR